jgi:hypothetical protein
VCLLGSNAPAAAAGLTYCLLGTAIEAAQYARCTLLCLHIVIRGGSQLDLHILLFAHMHMIVIQGLCFF